MKKIFFCILIIFIFNLILYAGPWKSYKAFKEYLAVKNKAKQADAEGNTYNAVKYYLKAAEIAAKSADADVHAWQLNNAAFSLIVQFKKLVNYDEKLQKLTEMKPGKEKISYQKEFANLLNMQMPLLTEAEKILDKTKKLGDELEAKEKIQSNLDFIKWIKDFITANLDTVEENLEER